MKLRPDKNHISMGITAFLVICCSILFYYLLFHGSRISAAVHTFAKILSPVLYGIVLAYLLTPIVNFFEKKILTGLFSAERGASIKSKKYKRALAVFLTILIVLFIIYGFFYIVIPDLVRSIRNISIFLPIYVKNLSGYADKYLQANPEAQSLLNQLFSTYSGEISQYLNTSIFPTMESVLRTVSLSLIGVFKVAWNLIIGLIISVYVLFSKEIFAAQGKKILYAILPTKTANEVIEDIRYTSDTFISFISGKIIDSIIIGIICFIGTTLLHIPYALLVSVIVGFTNIIPFFGPYLGAIPSALLILMSTNPIKCVTFIIFILILQQIDGNIIGPKILGDSTGLSGFWVIFSITIFGGYFGIFGMIIGVPLFAVLYNMIKRIVEKNLRAKSLPSGTSAYYNLDHIDEELNFVPQDTSVRRKFFSMPYFNKIKDRLQKKPPKEKGEQ